MVAGVRTRAPGVVMDQPKGGLVPPAGASAGSGGAGEAGEGRAIFVTNFSRDTTAGAITALFQKYGAVSRLDMKRGFCFIFMADDEAGRAALSNLHDSAYLTDGSRRRLVVQWARGDGAVKRREDERRRSSHAPNETLFVVNFDAVTTRQETLRAKFEPFGAVVRLDLQERFAFVQYETTAAATAAIAELNGSSLDDRRLIVEYSAPRNTPRTGPGGGRKRDRSASPPRGVRSPRRFRPDDWDRRGPPPMTGPPLGMGYGGGPPRDLDPRAMAPGYYDVDYDGGRPDAVWPPREYNRHGDERGRGQYDVVRRSRGRDRGRDRERDRERDRDRGRGRGDRERDRDRGSSRGYRGRSRSRSRSPRRRGYSPRRRGGSRSPRRRGGSRSPPRRRGSRSPPLRRSRSRRGSESPPPRDRGPRVPSPERRRSLSPPPSRGRDRVRSPPAEASPRIREDSPARSDRAGSVVGNADRGADVMDAAGGESSPKPQEDRILRRPFVAT